MTNWLTRTTQDYRRGFVEGQAGQFNAYLLANGASDMSEYKRGFEDGLKKRLDTKGETATA